MKPEKKIILRPISAAIALNDAHRLIQAIRYDMDKDTITFRLGQLNQYLLCQAGYYEEDPKNPPKRRRKGSLQGGA